MAHTESQGLSKCPSYISQNKHFTGASAVLQHYKFCAVSWKKKPSVTEESLLQSPGYNCLQDKASVSSEERFKTSTINRRNTDVDWHRGFSQSPDDHKLNLCCIPSAKQSWISILRYTPSTSLRQIWVYLVYPVHTSQEAQPFHRQCFSGNICIFHWSDLSIAGMFVSNPVTELNWLVM